MTGGCSLDGSAKGISLTVVSFSTHPRVLKSVILGQMWANYPRQIDFEVINLSRVLHSL